MRLPTRPLVSVVLPTRNRARLLPRAIRSVLAQTYKSLELIIVNDSSTDETADIIAQFSDPRIRSIHLISKVGAAAARNVGIRAAKGEVLAFQDDDDQWLIERIERQLPSLLQGNPAIGISLGAYIQLWDDGPRYVGCSTVFNKMDFAEGPRGDWSLSATPAWLVKRHYLVQAGMFDERLHTLEDWELLMRLSEVCEFAHVAQPLFIQDRKRGDRLWNNERLLLGALRLILEKHRERWDRHPSAGSHIMTLIGSIERRLGVPAAARRWQRSAILRQPKNLRAWAELGVSYLRNGLAKRDLIGGPLLSGDEA